MITIIHQVFPEGLYFVIKGLETKIEEMIKKITDIVKFPISKVLVFVAGFTVEKYKL